MNLSAPERYDRAVWQQLLNQLARAWTNAFAKGQDVELARGERLILRSPSGARFAVKVDNAGNLSTVAL
jgi:hypothetical protein